MKDLKECPCGKIPKKLIISDAGQGGKWAYVGGDCCEDWEIEFATGYYDLKSDECLVRARVCWNIAKRASIPISKIQELIKQFEGKVVIKAVPTWALQKLIEQLREEGKQ